MLERLLDRLAREIRIDPVEIRRRNLIPPLTDGHNVVTGLTYDSGNYQAALDKALSHIGYEQLRKEQAAAREKGRYIGIGSRRTWRSAASVHRRSPARSASRAACGRAPSSASIPAARCTSSSALRRTDRARRQPSPKSWPTNSA